MPMRIIHNLYHFKKKCYDIQSGIDSLDLLPEVYHNRYKGLLLYYELRANDMNADAAMHIVINQYGLSKSSWYRIIERYQTEGITGVIPHSKRPKKVRVRQWDDKFLQRLIVIRCHEDSCTWGAKKIRYHLIHENKLTVPSVATIERMIRYLKDRGLILSVGNKVKRHTKHKKRAHAVRYRKQEHQELHRLQLDIDYYYLDGHRFYHYGAIHVPSRLGYACSYRSISAHNMTEFLQQAIQALSPYCRIDAIQVDGGSEFRGKFEQYCQKHNLLLVVNRPHTPKQNCYIERFHRTIDEEFYQTRWLPDTCEGINELLADWMIVYNAHRMHTTIGMTPQEKANMLYSKETTAEWV